jgi:hypothetical protein
MDIKSVREALHKQPFEPFAIRLTDGRSLPVAHPDFVAIVRRRIIVIADDSSWSVVAPILIVSLYYDADGKKKGTANGKRRRKE